MSDLGLFGQDIVAKARNVFKELSGLDVRSRIETMLGAQLAPHVQGIAEK